jgi:hypothetical protein
MSGEKKETSQRSRVDHTQELEPPERRLDEIARLFAAESICVAVAVIDGRLYATANGLYKKSRSSGADHITSSIKSIGEYFRNLAIRQPQDHQDRERAFLATCSPKRLTFVAKQAFSIPNDLTKDAAKAVLNYKSNGDKLHSIIASKGRNAGIFGFAYGEYTKLRKAFTKLEESIKSRGKRSKPSAHTQSSSPPEEETLTPEQLVAISVEVIMLNDEPQDGVHAEVQMLSYIIRNLAPKYLNKADNKKRKIDEEELNVIYIGISKLCCLNCEKMLTSANNIFEERQIPLRLDFRGTHGLNFLKKPVKDPDNKAKKRKGKKENKETEIVQIEIDLESRDRWVCPELFSLGYTEGEKPDDKPLAELAYEIGQRTQAALKPARMQPAPRRSSMEPDTSASPSPPSSATASGQQQQRLMKTLEDKAAVLKELLEESNISSKGEVQRFADKVAIAKKLCEANHFKFLLDVDIGEASGSEESLRDPETVFFNIVAEYQKSHSSSMPVDTEQLLKILKDPKLVGKQVSGYFKDFSLSSSIPSKKKGEEKAESGSSQNPASKLPAPIDSRHHKASPTSSSSSSFQSSFPSSYAAAARKVGVFTQNSAPPTSDQKGKRPKISTQPTSKDLSKPPTSSSKTGKK